jgi:hypothetical protein
MWKLSLYVGDKFVQTLSCGREFGLEDRLDLLTTSNGNFDIAHRHHSLTD